jgi:5'-deoxynucleotidase YfbR-like HD superfamily hydrolase
MTPPPKEPWISTFTGKKIYPWDPKPEDIEILDIAISLSRTARFRAHTTGFYSVAQHSLLASHLVPFSDMLWGLLHDAPEAYIGDFPGPLKQMVPEYEVAEQALMRAVCDRFGLPHKMPPSVEEVDLLLLVSEADRLMHFHPEDWHLKFGVKPDRSLFLDLMDSDTAFREFMFRFETITGKAFS